MKKIISLILMTFTFMVYSYSQSNYQTYAHVQDELTESGYIEIANPGGYQLSFTGATVHFYIKAGVAEGIVVYHYPSENDLPEEAKECPHRAYETKEGETVTYHCDGEGKDCKVVVKTDSTGQTYGVEVVCCG
jgi:hypothetical protein